MVNVLIFNCLELIKTSYLILQVYTRSAASIRGFCVGFVEAFDKHWNVVLKDVFETWNRPRKKRSNLFVGKEKVSLIIVTRGKITGVLCFEFWVENCCHLIFY